MEIWIAAITEHGRLALRSLIIVCLKNNIIKIKWNLVTKADTFFWA